MVMISGKIAFFLAISWFLLHISKKDMLELNRAKNFFYSFLVLFGIALASLFISENIVLTIIGCFLGVFIAFLGTVGRYAMHH